ncbi:hypothetical protein C2E21_6160 [Chlorella sorokiniana]|uniref:Uncharacterized protein n=1 Tax=Chlorella sorokiniana TaxID=3076 RepID=A0A2P6TLL6_CHLSO|nr:hypothetical protein C2E21_6160 [Chlorella sorokiniana]|eukprot:PRW45187.1 hypothetical protein C2E21_6160 [Chlorella sorokiniana]
MLLGVAPETALVPCGPGFLPIHWAVQGGDVSLINLLLEAAPERATATTAASYNSSGGLTAAAVSAQKDQPEALQLLLAKLAMVANKEGWLPIHSAASEGHASVVEVLLRLAPESAIASTREQYTAAMMAAFSGHAASLKLLIDAAPELLFMTNREGCTCTYFAAEMGHVDCLQLLLHRAPALAAAPTEGGFTAAHLAATLGQEATLQLLLEAAPSAATALTDKGSTPAHLAAEKGRTACLQLLMAAAPETAVVGGGGRAAVVELLCSLAPESAGVARNDGVTPLFVAVENGREDLVELLLKDALDAALLPTCGALERVGPAHIAAMQGHAGVLKRILEAAPQASEQRDIEGRTPLDVAVQHCRVKAVQVLQEHRGRSS